MARGTVSPVKTIIELEWSFNSADLYGTTFSSTPNSVYYFVATYAVAVVIYVVARIVRKRQGIDLARIHHEIPVE